MMQSWAGLPIALAVVTLGLWVGRKFSRIVGGITVFSGVLLLLGATFAVVKSHHGISPPGTLVDVGGHRVHLWCEGSGEGPTVVWLPGGYGQAMFSYRNHQDIKGKIRSCLIDRRNVGWADPGPWDFSPEEIARDLMTALDAGGEKGPYLIAGHSFGGFYASNVAALYPDEVAGIAMLDPTAPAWIDYFAYGMCGDGKPRPLHQFASLFGLAWIEALNPLLQNDALQSNAGKFWPAMIAQELHPRTFHAQSAALDTPCKDILSFVREPGQLGDTPILLITQHPSPIEEDSMAPDGAFRLKNYKAFRDSLVNNVLDLSSDSLHLYAPQGAGHEFPTTEPEFTRDHVLAFQRELSLR